MKPGWQTSEFWLALVALVVSSALSTGLIPAGEWERVASTIAMVLGALGYGAQRAKLKDSA